jgi:hypothetical protein
VAVRGRENLTAAAVTLVVVAVVLLVSRVPLPVGLTIDLRAARPLGGARGVTLVGFSPPRPVGRMLEKPVGTLIVNRALPHRFDLEMEGRGFGRALPVAFEVRVGDSRYAGAFDGDPSVHTMHVDNPGGERQIEIRAPKGGASVILTRLTLR